MLHAIKPSQRKCLAGLDDVTAAGMNAFAQLQNVANKFNSKSCFDASERSKHYLKTCYPIHCSDTDTDIAFILQNLLCLIRRTNSYNLIPICRILTYGYPFWDRGTHLGQTAPLFRAIYFIIANHFSV